MKDEELKNTVIEYASMFGVMECSELFRGIVSRDCIYKWVRNKKSLDYRYTDEQCKRELINLTKSVPSYTTYPTRNRIVHTYQPHFFDKERKLWSNKSIRNKLIENRTKYLNKTEFSDREILRGFKISGIHIGFSHFSPLWFVKFIKDNNIKSVYDPCGGWGHRMIGASICDIDYIYNDKWDKTFEGCKRMSDFLDFDCIMYNEDCTTFTPTGDYECIFTCPPYDNVEIYNDEVIADYNKFLVDMFKCSIKESVNTIAIVINKPYIDKVIDACPFKIKEIITLGTTDHKSHFNISNSHKGEYLLHFIK
jgi:hypothetical protein